MAKRIVITGGPGTGKTSVIKMLEEKGYFCFHEVIREMTLEAKSKGDPETMVTNPIAFVDDPLKFNKHILDARLAHYKQGEDSRESIVFYDRGLPDVLAYMHYFDQHIPQDFIAVCEKYRYDEVVVLPPWEAIYAVDETRLENFMEAKAIHEELVATYLKFGYHSCEIPIGTIEERVQFIIDTIICPR